MNIFFEVEDGILFGLVEIVNCSSVLNNKMVKGINVGGIFNVLCLEGV